MTHSETVLVVLKISKSLDNSENVLMQQFFHLLQREGVADRFRVTSESEGSQ